MKIVKAASTTIFSLFVTAVYLLSAVEVKAAGSIRDLFGAGGGSTIDDPGEIFGEDGIIDTIFTVAFSAAGVATMAMIIMGGFNFIFSEGDAQKIAAAQKTIISGVIGLIIVILSVLIFDFLAVRVLQVDMSVFNFNF
jgi:hypothetical protein